MESQSKAKKNQSVPIIHHVIFSEIWQLCPLSESEKISTLVLLSQIFSKNHKIEWFIHKSVWSCLLTYRDSLPKNENSVINYSPSCRSKPIRPLFIFGTQIKIFLMKYESSLTLHRQQCNCNVPRSRNVARTSVKQTMWHQWLNFGFVKLREYFFVRKENKNNNLFNNSSPPSYVFRHFLLRFWTWEHCSCVAVYGGSESAHISLKIS